MVTEASERLVSKLIIICFIFTLYQLDSEFNYQCMAQILPHEEGIFIINFISFSSKSNKEKIPQQNRIQFN